MRAGEYGDGVPAVTGFSDADLRAVDCSAELLRARVDVPLDAEAPRVAWPAFVTRRLALFWVAALSSVSRAAVLAPAVRVPRPAGAPRFAVLPPASLTEAWRRPGVPRPAWVSPAAVRFVAPLPEADLRPAPVPCVPDACVAGLAARPPVALREAVLAVPVPAEFLAVLADFVVLAACAVLPAVAPEDADDFFVAVLRSAPLSASSRLPAELRAEVRFAVVFVPLLAA